LRLTSRFPPVFTLNHLIVVAALFIFRIQQIWVQSSFLPSIEQLLFVFNLQRVKSACCTGKTDSIIFNIDNNCMLSHQSASKHYILLILNICGHTVLIVILHVKVLAWEPVVSIQLTLASRILFSVKHESKNRQRFEELQWAIIELTFVIIPTEVARLLKVHFAFAVVYRIHSTEPFEMSLNKVEKLSWKVRKCRARINHHCVPTSFRTSH